MKKGIRIAISLIFIVSVIALIPVCAGAYAVHKPIRVINVVYDDSVTTINENGSKTDKWCQEKYALELFTSLLGENDTMHVYYMSSFADADTATAEISMSGRGEVDKNVEKIHNKFTDLFRVNFDAVTAAYNDLTGVSADEKWLVVLTNRDFPDRESMDNLIASKRKDVKIAVLALGDTVSQPNADERSGVYFFAAANSKEIPGKMAELCCRVFNIGMLVPETDTDDINFDVSVGEVVVVASGSRATVNGFKNGNGTLIRSDATAKLKYSEKATSDSRYSDVIFDDKLEASVAVFRNGFETGEYTLDVSYAESVTVFFKPNVDIGVSFVDSDGGEITDLNLLESGSYRVELYLVDTQQESRLEKSELLGDVDFSAVVINNSTGKNILSSSGESIDIVEGTLSVEVSAEYAGIKRVVRKSYSIFENKQITFETVSVPAYEISRNKISNGSQPVRIKASLDGEEFTDGQWKTFEAPGFEVRTQGNQGLNSIRVEKSERKGFVDIYLSLADGKTTSGTYLPLSITLISNQKVGIEKWEGTVTVEIPVNDNRGWIERNFLTALKILGVLALIAIIVGYIPPVKKYLPKKMGKRPRIECTYKDSNVGKKKQKGKFKKSFLSTLCPFMAQRGKLIFAPADAEKAPAIKLVARTKDKMLIKNRDEFKSRDDITVMTSAENPKGKPKYLGTETHITYITPVATYNCTFKKKPPKKEKAE